MSVVALPRTSSRTILAALVGMVTMLFLAFTAAYIERRAAAGAWVRVAMPPIVWINTGVLLSSSVALELARRGMRKPALFAALALGLAFLAGQLVAWRQLAAQGVFLDTSPHASFFYLLTAVHGVHLVAGLIALFSTLARPALLGACAIFWHFLGAVWAYLLLVLML